MSVHEQNGFNFGIPYFINFKGHSIHQSINLMKNCKPRNKRKAIEVAEGAYLLTTIVSDIFAAEGRTGVCFSDSLCILQTDFKRLSHGQPEWYGSQDINGNC